MQAVRICAVGIGNRARKYLEYLTRHPEQAQLCAIVDNDPEQLENARLRYSLPESCCFSCVEELVGSGIKADGVIIATFDSSHFPIAKLLMSRGFNILLEKPLCETAGQAEELAALARQQHVVTALCYVMRYHPYYRRLKEIISGGRLGSVTGIRHSIFIGIERMTHTFVRGLWSRAEESSPIFVSKCCHDVDLLFWLAGISASQTVEARSEGGLSKYVKSNAPHGSTERCIGCPLERECRYSAVDLYRRRHEWISNFKVLPGMTIDDAIEAELTSGRYGRCVYRCDNDVFDHQTTRYLIDGRISFEITMDGITDKDCRETTFTLSNGSIIAKGGMISAYDTDGNQILSEDYRTVCAQPFHAGADLAIMADFCDAVRNGRPTICSIEDSLPGTISCFKAQDNLSCQEVHHKDNTV